MLSNSPNPNPPLTLPILLSEAKAFAEVESSFPEPSLFGVTDGKAIGTYLEKKFRAYLAGKYSFSLGNSASGIDFPSLDVDMKVTSAVQPQSSCPFKSARQKVFGLGYSLLVFVYEKTDDAASGTATLDIKHAIFVEAGKTADWQTTAGIKRILENEGNEDDLISFFASLNLPIDSIEAKNIAADILAKGRIEPGYLTISNALQWRLQYSRVIQKAGEVAGVDRVR